MRGSEMAAAGLGVNVTLQRVVVFGLAGAIAGLGGVLVSIHNQVASPTAWNYNYSLIFVVLVVTTSVATVEGAVEAGIGFFVVTQLLTYLPSRFGGQSLAIVLFAFGAMQYAKHPEGVVEFQKRRATRLLELLFFTPDGDNVEMAVSTPHARG
jgi:ABC-type branched-subunit amino acid transport system permease subunit